MKVERMCGRVGYFATIEPRNHVYIYSKDKLHRDKILMKCKQ